MNLLLFVVLVSILLLVLGNPSSPSVEEQSNVPKDTGYKVIRDYYLDESSVYGAFQN
jgi:hypothetical protein